jgi:hypothetical protein
MLFFRLETNWRRHAPGVALAALLSLSIFQAGAGEQGAGEQAMNILATSVSGPLRCEIRKDDASGVVALTGVVVGALRSTGNFRFAAMKSGSAGASNIVQSDHFDVDANKEAVVGRIRIALERGARLALDLAVRSDDGLECRATAQLGQ